MGIKGLNKWLKTNIRSSFIRRIPQIDTLFIDAKQFYYKSLEQCSESEVIPIFLSKIQYFIETYTPLDTLFLAMDGPNPAAKFQTQRERKFESEFEPNFKFPTKQQFLASYDEEQYGENVNKALEEFLPNLLSKSKIKSKQFLFSSGYAPGESEHKYFQYFREQKDSRNWKSNQNHFIVSNDNDLIFLSLQFIDENFYIIKFWENNGRTNFDYVDITEVRRYFLNLIYNPFGNDKYGYNNDIDEGKVIDDIVALSFLLGNDFIPPFPEIESNDVNSFQKLLNIYVSMNANNRSHYKYLIDDDAFNVSTLNEFVKLFFRNDHRQFQNYNKLNENQKRQAKNMSQMILRTLNFTWIYYSSGVPCWTFYYPYLQSPSLKMAVQLMVQEGSEVFDDMEDDEIIDPYLKTLITRPAHSTSNIPWNIYKIKIPPSEIASKYWPLIKPGIQVPIFDLNEIKIHYKKALKTLTQEEMVFNRRDPPYFVYPKTKYQQKRKVTSRKRVANDYDYS